MDSSPPLWTNVKIHSFWIFQRMGCFPLSSIFWRQAHYFYTLSTTQTVSDKRVSPFAENGFCTGGPDRAGLVFQLQPTKHPLPSDIKSRSCILGPGVYHSFLIFLQVVLPSFTDRITQQKMDFTQEFLRTGQRVHFFPKLQEEKSIRGFDLPSSSGSQDLNSQHIRSFYLFTLAFLGLSVTILFYSLYADREVWMRSAERRKRLTGLRLRRYRKLVLNFLFSRITRFQFESVLSFPACTGFSTTVEGSLTGKLTLPDCICQRKRPQSELKLFWGCSCLQPQGLGFSSGLLIRRSSSELISGSFKAQSERDVWNRFHSWFSSKRALPWGF